MTNMRYEYHADNGDHQEDLTDKDDQRNDIDEFLDFASYDFPNYQCNNGKCHNITGVYSCRINETNIMNQVLFIILIFIHYLMTIYWWNS